MDSLRFNVLIQRCKKQWSAAGPKYTEVRDARLLLLQLKQQPLQWNVNHRLRDRLILLLRIFHLMRSVDCSRIKRTISFIVHRHFFLVCRKGWKHHQWEEIISLPHNPSLSPWHVLRQYVALTAAHVSPGGALFVTMTPPFKPLSADRLGSLTKGFVNPIWDFY